MTQMDLAQATAYHSPKWLRYTLWVILELALMATDLAEVLGSAIALNLLFGIPIMVAILVTVLDVFLLLLIMKRDSKNRGYCFNLDFDYLGYLCLSGSLV